MRITSLVLVTALSVSACSDASGPNAAPVTLSFSTLRSVSGQFLSRGHAPAAGSSLAAITLTGGGNTLVVNRVRLVLDEIELEEFSGRECDNSGPGHDPSCLEIEIGPFLVDLPMTEGVRAALTAQIPAGSYHEIEFEIEPVDDSNAGARQFFAAHPDVPRNRSILVEGTYNGQPFVFMSSDSIELELEFEPNLVVDGGTNITVDVDVASWFQAGTTVLDPRDAASAPLIEARIRASFAACQDDDRDGRRDRGRGGDDD